MIRAALIITAIILLTGWLSGQGMEKCMETHSAATCRATLN